MPAERHPITRRTILAIGASGALGALITPAPMATATSTDANARPGDKATITAACGASVTAQSEIANVPTYYESSGTATSFSYDATFYSRLETWWNFWYINTPSSWTTPGRMWGLGAYKDRMDGCVSMHNYGRALDITRLYISTPSLTKVFDGRYNVWQSQTGTTLTTTRKRYWATVASLHYHFRSVLTYLYNSDHDNHVHADNGYSGVGDSTFLANVYPQVQHVQACLVYIWGYNNVPLNGLWDQATADAAKAALQRAGINGWITDSQENWLQFNKASLRFGTGKQTY